MGNREQHLFLQKLSRAPDHHVPAAGVPRFIGGSMVTIRDHYVYPLHQHTHYEVILVSKGTYLCSINDQPIQLEKNQGLVVKSGDQHKDFCENPLEYFALHFEMQASAQGVDIYPLFADPVQPEQQTFEANGKAIWAVVDAIHREQEIADPASPHIQDALCLQFFWRLIRALPREGISNRFLNASLEQALPLQLERLFRDHLEEAIAVSDMAKELGMSESSLSHRCKAVLGVSPARAFVIYKMERAEYLLRNTTMPVKEIGFRIGFTDPYHFSRTFKRIVGKPPSAFR